MSKSKAVHGPSLPLVGRLWREHISRYWPLLLANLALIAVVAAATSAYPALIKWASERFEAKDFEVLVWLPALVVLATAIKGAALYAHLALTNSVLSRIVTDIQERMYRHLVEGDLARIARETPAALASHFTTDLNYIREASHRLITTLVRDMLTTVGLLAAMLWIDWQLALISFAVLPVAAWPVAAIGQRLRRVAKRTQAEMGDMNAYVTESLTGVRLVKSFRLEAYVRERANAVFESIHQLRVKAANQRSRVEPIMEVLGGLAVAGVFLLIGWRIGSGQATMGQFTGFIAALLLAAQPMRGLGNLNIILQEGLAAAERVFALIDDTPRIRDIPGAPALAVSQGTIRLENVGFAYDDGTLALDGIDLEIPGGQTVALVGRSGAGKSTVFNLIPRLFDVTSGRVTIDGQDIRQVSLASLRDAVAVVSQEVFVFNDTARANIGFGKPGADEAAIIAAAKAAHAHDFISRSPDGYDTMLGEAGTRLSGGERQRLALARAILKDAPVLLLDEATSALDAESETVVQAALAELKQGRTTLVIAHRLSTVRDADRIVVMDRGRIAETGTHDELIAQGGIYAGLYRMQFRDDTAE